MTQVHIDDKTGVAIVSASRLCFIPNGENIYNAVLSADS